MTQRLYSWLGLLAVAVLLIGLNVFSYSTLRNTRIDLTENKVHTLSKGTRNILADIGEPITLKFYYSRKLASTAVPGLSAYVVTVQELLEEYRDSSNGKIKLEVIDPEPFSEQEEDASLAGVQSIPIGATGEPMFLGLVGTNSVDENSVIPFFDPNKESFLEYDITSLIYNLNHPKKKKIGVMSWLPVMGDNDPMAAMRGEQGKQQYAFIQQLRETADVQEIDTKAEKIPADLDVLLVIHPKEPTAPTLYAIDQYVLHGGRAMIFVDPQGESDIPPTDPNNPYAAMWASKASSLQTLMDKWGVRMKPDVIAGDRKLAERVNVRSDRGTAESVAYVGYMSLQPEQFNSSDVITSGLGLVRVGSAGILEAIDGATTSFEPLLTTTEDSMEIPVDKIRLSPQPNELLSEFKPLGKKLTLAARISGKIKTAYPGGLPNEAKKEGEKPAEPNPDHLEESKDSVQIIVVADTDILADRFWVSVQEFFGRRILYENASNGSFVGNSVENLGGSNDLIAVRSRGKTSRPFDRVNDLKRQAEDRYRERQTSLEKKITELQQKINEIQANRSDKSASTGVILTPEQKAAIEQARDEYANTRKELRNVQYELSRDVQKLGTSVKAINIAAIPLLVGLYAVVLGLARTMKRRT